MKNEIINNDALTVRVNTEPIEETLDQIDNALDVIEAEVEKAVRVTKNNPVILAGVALVALGVGGYVGYRIGVKQTTLKYERIIEEQIDSTRKFYQRLAKDGEYSTPESAAAVLIPEEEREAQVVSAENAADALNTYKGEGRDRKQKVSYDKAGDVQTPRDDKTEVKITNVFVERDAANAAIRGNWDYNAELEDRKLLESGTPYVISFDEFNEGLTGQDQQTITYYKGDDILVDESDKPIDDTEFIVGDDNLLRFGHGSNDPKIVYVRNERIGVDFEIVLSEGSYQEEVLGLKPQQELRHSHNRRRGLRFRGADE